MAISRSKSQKGLGCISPDFFRRNSIRLIGSLLFWSAVTLTVGCLDIKEEKLQDAVELIAPGDSLVTRTQTIKFNWIKNEDASSYEFIVVEPTFDEIATLVRKETTTDTQIDVTLPEGSYQWKIKAINSVSEIESSIRTIVIELDSLSTGANQRVALLSPPNDLSTNSTDVQLLWSSLTGAIYYDIEVASPVFGNSTFLIVQDSTTEDFFNLNIAEEGQYSWRVRAVYPNNVRTVFTLGTFQIDRTAPTPPSPTSPVDGSLASAPVTLQWDSDSDVILDTLQIRRDSIGGVIVLNQAYTSSQATYTTTDIGEYYWRVRSLDAAENLSDYSDWQHFDLE